MRETTTLTLEGRGLRRRLARLRPRAAGRARAVTGKAIAALARAAELAIVLAGWALIPLLPVLAAAIARDRQYLARYPASVAQVARHIRATWRGRVLSRIFVRWFEPAAQRQSQRIVGSCSHCGNCCLYRSCVFLRFDDQGRSRCRIYGGRLWKRLTCGAYPLDAAEIELYGCPSFAAVPETPAHRVIRVVPARSPVRGDGA